MLYLKVQHSTDSFNIYSGMRVLVSGGLVIVENAIPSDTIFLHFTPNDRHVAFFIMNADGKTFERFTGSDLVSLRNSDHGDQQQAVSGAAWLPRGVSDVRQGPESLDAPATFTRPVFAADREVFPDAEEGDWLQFIPPELAGALEPQNSDIVRRVLQKDGSELALLREPRKRGRVYPE